MANRSLIFSLDKLPGEGKLRIKRLSESEYNIPLIYRILVSVNPKATHSIIWKTDEKIAKIVTKVEKDYDLYHMQANVITFYGVIVIPGLLLFFFINHLLKQFVF